jgi:hypothetical protein
MPLRRSTLRFICFLVIIGYALYLETGFLSRALKRFNPEDLGRDRVSLAEERYSEIRALLPEYGNVGFFNETSIQSRKLMMEKAARGEPIDEEASRMFKEYRDRYFVELLHVQYALAPLKVILTPDCRFMIGDIEDPHDKEVKEFFEAEGYAVEKALDNGLILIKKVLE